jgi:hypothetical protein
MISTQRENNLRNIVIDISQGTLASFPFSIENRILTWLNEVEQQVVHQIDRNHHPVQIFQLQAMQLPQPR